MNYRHIYHAGNFADVFKHWILVLILEKLCEKPTPFCVIDTHAGPGTYDLQDPGAQKTLEYQSGIELFLAAKPEPAFAAYYKIANEYKQSLNFYPGSPAIVQHFLRERDRLWCSELHPDDYLVLNQTFASDLRIKVQHQDGYQSIKALLPPIERRGLVFIDPPFEQKDEVSQLVNCLKEGLQRFAHGIYAVWYPIKDTYLIQKFYHEVRELKVPDSFYIELHTNNAVDNRLSSCGMLVLNAPWQLADKLQANMPLLMQYLQLDQGNYKLRDLN